MKCLHGSLTGVITNFKCPYYVTLQENNYQLHSKNSALKLIAIKQITIWHRLNTIINIWHIKENSELFWSMIGSLYWLFMGIFVEKIFKYQQYILVFPVCYLRTAADWHDSGNLLGEAGNTQCRRSHQNSIIGLVYGEYVVTVVSRSRCRLKRTDKQTKQTEKEMCT